MTPRKIFTVGTVTAACLMAPFVLTACNAPGLSPMPTGYIYHGQAFKAPPEQKSDFKMLEESFDPKKAAPAQAAPLMEEYAPPAPVVQSVPVGEGMPMGQAVPQDLSVSGAVVEQAPLFPAATSSAVAGSPEEWATAAADLAARLERRFGHPAGTIRVVPGGGDASSITALSAFRSALQAQGYRIDSSSNAAKYMFHYKPKSLGLSGASRVLVTVTLMDGDKKAAEESGIYTIDGFESGASGAAGVFGGSAPVPAPDDVPDYVRDKPDSSADTIPMMILPGSEQGLR